MANDLIAGRTPDPDGEPAGGDAASPRRTAIIVSGMHRSGTSAITRVISLLGGDLPQELIEGKPDDNQRGFWEGRAVVDLDELVLDATGTWWCGWQDVDTDRLQRRSLVVTRAREILCDQLGDAELVVLKDPRLSRTMPLWQEALRAEGFECVHVVAVRDPGEVASSVLRRNELEAPASELAWLAHLLDAERHTRGDRRVFVSFEHLMGGWRHEARRMSRHLAVDWPRGLEEVAAEVEAYVEPTLRHSVALPMTVSGPLRDLFLRWCVDDVRETDADELDAWRRRLGVVRRLPSPTVHASRSDSAAVSQQRLLAAERRPWRTADRAAFTIEARLALGWVTARLDAERATTAAEEGDAAAAARVSATEDRAAKALHMLSSQATTRVSEMRQRAQASAGRRDEALRQLAIARERNQGLREQLRNARHHGAGARRARALVYELLAAEVAATKGRPWAAERRREAVERLQRSGLFDAEDYLHRYPDATTGGLSPAEHFLVHGHALGHQPEPERKASPAPPHEEPEAPPS